MPTILVAGTKNQPFASFSQVIQSQDGINWSDSGIPFGPRDFCTGIATNGSLWLISNQRGLISSTTDLLNYKSVIMNDGFGTTSLACANSAWLSTGSYNYINGFGPYPAKTQVAQIYRSNYGDKGWQMVWTHPTDSSIFYQVQHFPNAPITNSLNADVWVVVGNNGTGQGDIWYSLDSGVSWTQAQLPSNIGVIYSVTLYQLSGQPVWYWGTRGKIFLSSNLHTATWDEVLLDNTDTAVGFTQSSTGTLLVNGSNKLYTSLDGVIFRTFSYSGYVWGGVTVMEFTSGPRWLAFANSTLTQYTYWLSYDLVNWTPLSNGITSQASTVFG
jgi:hypothetical protein